MKLPRAYEHYRSKVLIVIESSFKKFSDFKQKLDNLHILLIHAPNKQLLKGTNNLSFTTNSTFVNSIEKKCQSAIDTITELISQLNWMLRHTGRLFESGLCEANTTNFANSVIQLVRELHQKLYLTRQLGEECKTDQFLKEINDCLSHTNEKISANLAKQLLQNSDLHNQLKQTKSELSNARQELTVQKHEQVKLKNLINQFRRVFQTYPKDVALTATTRIKNMEEVVSELTRALEHVSAHHQHETKLKFLAAQHETINLGNLLVERENKIVELTQQLGLHKGPVHAIDYS